MGEVDTESRAIRIGSAAPGAFFMDKEPRRNLKTGSPRIISRWRHLDDLPVYEFSLACDFV
jgi:hypothetical protein